MAYWLDTIKTLAPDSPTILVATHTDERAPDLNYAQYKAAYPQLADAPIALSNKDGRGLEELRTKLAELAAALPLMGQPWPQKWYELEQALAAHPAHHIAAAEYEKICAEKGVDAEIAHGTLGRYLHDLGKTLYFREDPVLSNLVVLKPNWVTKAISQVLTDELTNKRKGELWHTDLPRIWAKDEAGQAYAPHLYPIFLRLMERFYLSYQVPAETPGSAVSLSLVPQLFPHQPPANLPPWPTTPPAGGLLVEMTYKLDFVPAGIMSWFIVATHRYATGERQHWRDGVCLEYQGHSARAELNPMLCEIRLMAWGPQPHNFFTLLKESLDTILKRFEGLTFQRLVPCICHWERKAAPCPRHYRYDDLARRLENKRLTVECPDSFAEVSVTTLLYGLHAITEPKVMADLQAVRQAIRVEVSDRLEQLEAREAQQSQLLGQWFTRLWNLETAKLEIACPNTFLLMPGSDTRWYDLKEHAKNLVSQPATLYLLCQHPAKPHLLKGHNGYVVREPEKWWKEVAPWLNHLIKFLQFAVPMGKALGEVYDQAQMDNIKTSVG